MEGQNVKASMITISHEDLQELLERAAEIGANTGISRYAEELKTAQKKRGDKRLHNTKLLLRNYRMLEENAENSVFGRTQMQESAADILESMMNIYNDALVVESIKNSATRTGIIVSHVRTMLGIYEICCEKSSNELDKRRYDIIYGLYISDEKMTRKELAEKWNVSTDTTYVDEKIALERLSALIFGVDGLSFQ
nr:MAG TPA: RNA polymerase sigma factor [Caudoviricetes sp.]DAK02056.1 MAG TPA: RNA polymerase sigma factor [Caudoviricetes sp.]